MPAFVVPASVIGNGGAAKILFFQFLRNLLHCQGIRRSQAKNESKREEKNKKKAKDIGQNKQPKCQNIVRLVRFIGEGRRNGDGDTDEVRGLGIFGGLLSGAKRKSKQS